MNSALSHKIYTDALSTYLSNSFKVLEREQAQMASAVKLLERRTREQLVRSYGEENAWRGLACDDFLRAFDAMHAFEQVLMPVLEHEIARACAEPSSHAEEVRS